MKSLLSFDTMITPKFIKFFFYVGVLLCCFFGFATFVTVLTSFIKGAEMSGSSETMATILGLFFGVFAGLIVTLVGIVMVRVSSELTLVIFMIRDELAWQRENAISRTGASGN